MDEIHVSCSGDKNYLQHIGVMICSLFENNRKHKFVIHLFCHDTHSCKNDIENINCICLNYGHRLHIHEINIKRFDSFKTSKHISIATYFRFLLPEALHDLDKVIYLDGDIIVKDSIEELWNVDLEGKYLAAVDDIGVDADVFLNLNIPKKLGYFNAGVLVLNLKKIRDENQSKKWFSFASEKKDFIRFHDQCVLNYFVKNNRVSLHPRWNVMAQCFLGNTDLSVWDDHVINEAISNPAIVHFNCFFGKPWERLCSHPLRDLYWQYLELTPWKGFEASKANYLSFLRRRLPVIDSVLRFIRLFYKG